MNMRERIKQEYGNLKKFLMLTVATMLVCLVILGDNYKETHYAEGTHINQVNCSTFTKEEAKEKIEQSEVIISFADGTCFSQRSIDIGRTINDMTELEGFLRTQNEKNGGDLKDFALTSESFYVDTAILEERLERFFSECEIPTDTKPQNAYLRLTEEGYIEIVPEVRGNYIDITEALSFACDSLEKGENFIDFTPITEVEPEVRTNNSELALKADELNKVLNVEIEYTLTDGSTYSLNHEVTQYWIEENQSGEYYIDIEKRLTSFLEGLNEKVQELGSTMEFTDKEGKTTYLPVQAEYRNSVDIEAEKTSLMLEIQYGKSVTRSPIYARFNSVDIFEVYAEIWREKQLVYFYINGECVAEVNEAPCVTGTANTKWETPLGVFFVNYMQSPKEFKTYGGECTYWVQFTDDGIGFHDAPWRANSEFIPETYLTSGSHGCVNLQYLIAKFIYEHSYIGMPVIVH